MYSGNHARLVSNMIPVSEGKPPEEMETSFYTSHENNNKLSSHQASQQLLQPSKMPELQSISEPILIRDLPTDQKIKLAMQWLEEHPQERVATAARVHSINPRRFQQIRRRERKKKQRGPVQHGGQNRILNSSQHKALGRYATGEATLPGGMKATNAMMFNCASWIRKQQGKETPSKEWFHKWLQTTKELHAMTTEPISTDPVDMDTEAELRKWLEEENRPG